MVVRARARARVKLSFSTFEICSCSRGLASALSGSVYHELFSFSSALLELLELPATLSSRPIIISRWNLVWDGNRHNCLLPPLVASKWSHYYIDRGNLRISDGSREREPMFTGAWCLRVFIFLPSRDAALRREFGPAPFTIS